MSGYGKVISGGASMRKGVTKEINDKHEGFAKKHEHGKKIAGAVREAFTYNSLSEPHTNNIKGGKFSTPKRQKNV